MVVVVVVVVVVDDDGDDDDDDDDDDTCGYECYNENLTSGGTMHEEYSPNKVGILQHGNEGLVLEIPYPDSPVMTSTSSDASVVDVLVVLC
jgi:hypothetical protein